MSRVSIAAYPDDVHALSDAMILCRTVGHAWDEFTLHARRSTFGERLSLRCVRCTTERHDIISWVDGELLQREYRYVEGYALAESMSRAQFRRLLLTRRKAAARRRRAG